MFRHLRTAATQTPENDFVVAKLPKARRRGYGGTGKVEPVEVLHPPALLTNEMMMPLYVRLEPSSPSRHRQLPNQPRSGQRSQAVVDCGAGNLGVLAVHRAKDFLRSRMPLISKQAGQHRSPLRSAAKFSTTEYFRKGYSHGIVGSPKDYFRIILCR